MDRPFLFGVNYWPAAKAMYWWKDFSRDEVRRDFEKIKNAGLSAVRFFLLWEDFQPIPSRIDEKTLGKLAGVMAAGDEFGLKLVPTFFTGHMSGSNWIPAWALGGTDPKPVSYRIIARGKASPLLPRNLYEDPRLLEASALWLEKTLPFLASHRSLWAVNLGNEPSLVFPARSPQALDAWLETMTALIRRRAPRAKVLFGNLMTDLAVPNNYSLAAIAPRVDLSCMHTYPDFRGGPDPLLCAYTNILTERLGGKKVLLEEFGLPVVPDAAIGKTRSTIPLVPESKATPYFEACTENLIRAGAVGAFFWCYADYHESLFRRPPLDQRVYERYFGLFRADGSPKPHLSVIQSLIRSRPAVKQTPLLLRNISSSTYRPDHFWPLYKTFRGEWPFK